MRAFQDVIVRRQHQPVLEALARFFFVQVEHGAQVLHVSFFKVIGAVFAFTLIIHITIGVAITPLNGAEIVVSLQRHGDAFQAISDLHGDGVQDDAAGLLEISELRDLLPIQPDFPTQPPGAQCRRFPVVLHKTDIVFLRLDAQCLQRSKVKLLRIAWVGLQDNLKLVMLLQAVRVIAVAAVIRADRGLHVAHIPRFRTEHAQKSGRVHRSGSHLGVVWLPNQTAFLPPVFLQGHDHGLKIDRLPHAHSSHRQT